MRGRGGPDPTRLRQQDHQRFGPARRRFEDRPATTGLTNPEQTLRVGVIGLKQVQGSGTSGATDPVQVPGGGREGDNVQDREHASGGYRMHGHCPVYRAFYRGGRGVWDRIALAGRERAQAETGRLDHFKDLLRGNVLRRFDVLARPGGSAQDEFGRGISSEPGTCSRMGGICGGDGTTDRGMIRNLLESLNLSQTDPDTPAPSWFRNAYNSLMAINVKWSQHPANRSGLWKLGRFLAAFPISNPEQETKKTRPGRGAFPEPRSRSTCRLLLRAR